MSTTSNTTNILLPSVRALKTYQVPKSSARYIMNNYWTIPEAYSDLFPTYYLLSWSVDYFTSSIQDGIIEREGTRYQVIYHHTDPVEIAKHSGSLFLSFRELAHIYKAQPTVLVKIFTEKKER